MKGKFIQPDWGKDLQKYLNIKQLNKLISIWRGYRYIGWIMILVIFPLMLTSCDPCRKLSRGKILEMKDSAAYCYYEHRNYESASLLFDELKAIYRTDTRLEKTSFYFANCKYYTGNYIMAAFYYREFAQTFAASTYAEEANYMVAKCYYMQSLEHQLDQTETKKAIEYGTLYLQHYPVGKFNETCKEIIAELRAKLALKAFNNSNLYYKTRQYHAGIISFKNMLHDFPDSPYKDEAQYKLFVCAALYAGKSILEKKEERYLEAIAYYQKYVDRFEKGKFLKEAEELYTKIQEELKKNQILKQSLIN